MRVAILTYRATVGATATVARNLAIGFTEAGVDVDVLYLEGPAPESISEYPDGVQLIRLGGRSRTCWLRLARYLRERQPDTLISRGWVLNPAAVVATALARVETALFLTEFSTLSYKTRVEHRKQPALRILGVLARVLYPRADAVVGVSSPVVEDLENEIGLSARHVALHTIPNPVNARDVQLRSTLPDDGIIASSVDPVFVNVARHARQKNLPLLLRAFRRYLNDGGTGKLILIGRGPDTDALRTLASNLGIQADVVFRGRLANPFAQVSVSTAFVLSSEEEGFGQVLVEAMALGVPVISTDCPGGPREVLEHGESGVLVPNGDEQALANAMRRVADDASCRARLASSGRRRATDFDPLATARKWISIMPHSAEHSSFNSSDSGGDGGAPCL